VFRLVVNDAAQPPMQNSTAMSGLNAQLPG